MIKKLYVIGILIFVFTSCKYQHNLESNLKYCPNELRLLCSDSITPLTDYNLIDFRENVWEKLDAIFDNLFYCREVKLKVYFTTNSFDTLKLSLYTRNFENCDNDYDIPPFNPYIHWIHIYLDKDDTVYIRRQVSSIESVKDEVILRYQEIRIEEYSKVYIALLWDKESDKEKLTCLIEECINGYFEVANSFSFKNYGKSICELNEAENKFLTEKIPFKLRTDFWNVVSYDWDFVPHELPPE
jgi:hypothetical protein